MGWYHVNRIGKGICLGNVDEIHYKMKAGKAHGFNRGMKGRQQ